MDRFNYQSYPARTAAEWCIGRLCDESTVCFDDQRMMFFCWYLHDLQVWYGIFYWFISAWSIMVWYFSPLVYWYIILYHPLLVWYSHAMAWDSRRGRRFRFLRLEPSMNWTSWLRSSSRNGFFFFVDQLTVPLKKQCWHPRAFIPVIRWHHKRNVWIGHYLN